MSQVQATTPAAHLEPSHVAGSNQEEGSPETELSGSASSASEEEEEEEAEAAAPPSPAAQETPAAASSGLYLIPETHFAASEPSREILSSFLTDGARRLLCPQLAGAGCHHKARWQAAPKSSSSNT